MPLRSTLLSGNPRLEACLMRDDSHIKLGDAGDFVILIQDALRAIDGLDVAPGEIKASRYGSTTAAAVLSYKRKRKIINKSYESTEDNIVGKMTVKSLDDDLVAIQGKTGPNPKRFGGRYPVCDDSTPRKFVSRNTTLPPEGFTKDIPT